MKFWLGTHMTGWLADPPHPLFVSAVRLRKVKALPRAAGPWALDSGGFSEIARHGRWTVDAMTYSTDVRRWRDEIGGLEWAACQDWMCEPHMLAKTGFVVGEHQRRTTASYLLLKQLAPDLPWVPVLQGWEPDDYHRHADEYEAAGVGLDELPLVGVGSVCRRQATAAAGTIFRGLYARGYRLHGFGLKVGGLVGREKLCRYLASADSMAWSVRARFAWDRERERLCGGPHSGGCANCRGWAGAWARDLSRRIARSTRSGSQQFLF